MKGLGFRVQALSCSAFGLLVSGFGALGVGAERWVCLPCVAAASVFCLRYVCVCPSLYQRLRLACLLALGVSNGFGCSLGRLFFPKAGAGDSAIPSRCFAG